MITETDADALRAQAKDLASAIDKLIEERLHYRDHPHPQPIDADAIECRKMILAEAIIGIAVWARGER